jgi:sigma-B regulation protein RsbU (phosphoserine phosphatase)
MELVKTTASPTGRASEVEPLLLEVADVVNTTLDLETTLRRVAELVRKVIDYEIFAILLAQRSKRQELYVRFHVGYPPGVADRLRVKVGQGVTGRAARLGRRCWSPMLPQEDFYIEALPNVCSELAIPLIVKNRVIGVIDIEARERGYFTEEHKRLLTLIASRMAVGIENARLHTRIDAPGAHAASAQ